MLGSLEHDQRGVAYLTFYIIASLFVFGIVYALISDIRDATAIPIWNNIAPLGNEYNDSDSLIGFDTINLMISFSVTVFVIALIWFAKQMAQKPEQPW